MSVQLASKFIRYTNVPADGVQRTSSFVLDYNQDVYWYGFTAGIVRAPQAVQSTVTVSIDHHTLEGQTYFGGMFGNERSGHFMLSGNALMIPRAQAIAPEYTFTGGGLVDLSITVWFSGTAPS